MKETKTSAYKIFIATLLFWCVFLLFSPICLFIGLGFDIENISIVPIFSINFVSTGFAWTLCSIQCNKMALDDEKTNCSIMINCIVATILCITLIILEMISDRIDLIYIFMVGGSAVISIIGATKALKDLSPILFSREKVKVKVLEYRINESPEDVSLSNFPMPTNDRGNYYTEVIKLGNISEDTYSEYYDSATKRLYMLSCWYDLDNYARLVSRREWMELRTSMRELQSGSIHFNLGRFALRIIEK